MMVTRARFDTTAATPKLFFKAMRWLEADEYATTSEKGASPEAMQAIALTVSQQDGVAPAAALPAPKPIAPKAAPVADDEPPAPPPKKAKPAPVADDEEAPPPPPKKAKPAAAKPAPKEYTNGGEDDVPMPEPEVKKVAAPKAPMASGLASVLSEWDDE
jgi:DnaK suppressor protein